MDGMVILHQHQGSQDSSDSGSLPPTYSRLPPDGHEFPEGQFPTLSFDIPNSDVKILFLPLCFQTMWTRLLGSRLTRSRSTSAGRAQPRRQPALTGTSSDSPWQDASLPDLKTRCRGCEPRLPCSRTAMGRVELRGRWASFRARRTWASCQ